MFLSIYFCADGILRARNHDKPLIPLTFIQQFSDKKDDFSFWANWWKNSVHFEKGLTLSAFFSCLEPWENFFSTLTNVDIRSYIQEIRKPCPIDKQSQFSYIEIGSESIFVPELKHLEKVEWGSLLDLKEKAKEKRLMTLTGLWDITHRVSTHGYMSSGDNKDKRFGFHLSHPECYANVPMILNNQVHVSFANYTLNRYFEKEVSIFNEELPSVFQRNNIATLASSKHYHFREVIEVFFKDLMKTPQAAREFDQLLHSRMLAYMEREKIRAIEKEVEKTDSTNVISIHKNKESQTIVNTPEDKKVKFSMTSGFVDDLSKLGSHESELWNFLLDKAVSENTVLKIGKIEEQDVPEIRVFGHPVSTDDYITPSHPKLL